MKLSYKIPVVRGKQAKKEYYIGMIPLNMLSKLFPDDNEYVLPEYRAQRKLNEARLPEIKNYIINNKESYVFSALTASIDGKYEYVQSNIEDVGILEIALDSKFLINDGQHRKAAILAALEEDPSIGEETISIVFFADRGLKNSQQMFTDLNKHAVKTSNSISELYDSRDELAVTIRNVISKISFYDEYVDKERDILGKYSSSLFTLNTFYNASKKILKRGKCTKEFEEFLYIYWSSVANHMTPWNDLQNRDITKIDLRETYVSTQAIIIQAFGKVGAYFWENNIKSIDKKMKKIESINWKRSSNEWKLRVMKNDGRIINNETAITLAANYIKQYIGIPLSDEENLIEEKNIGDRN